MGSIFLVWQPVKEKENPEFKPVKVHLKIDLVSQPAQMEVLENIYVYNSVYIYKYKYI